MEQLNLENDITFNDNIAADKFEVVNVEQSKPKPIPRRRRCKECKKLYTKQQMLNHVCKPDENANNENVNNEENKENSEVYVKKLTKEYAAKKLYNLHKLNYMAIEMIMKRSENNNFDGLTDHCESMRKEYEEVFEQIYDQHGNEYFDGVLSPIAAYVLMVTGDMTTVYAKNQKKE